MLWQILGQMNTSISRQHITADLISVVRMIVIEQSEELFEKIRNPSGIRHEAMIYTNLEKNLKCRLSLTMLRETVLTGRSKPSEENLEIITSPNEKMLLDIPIKSDIWLTKSSTEKQIIFLIISIQQKKSTVNTFLLNLCLEKFSQIPSTHV